MNEEFTLLLEYARYVDKHRAKGNSKKKLLYFIAYRFLIPLMKVVHPLLYLFFKKKNNRNCEVLAVGTCRADIEGSSSVWNLLEKKGIKTERVYTRSKTDWLRCALMAKPEYSVPSRLYIDYHYAKHLVKKYNPAVVCTYYSYDVFPSMLRRVLNPRGKSIYMAHAIIPPTYLYTSVDYDYYFLFGRTSLENLRSQKILYGHTRVVMTGSPRIGKTYSLEPASDFRSVLFFSNWMIGRDDSYTKDFEIVKQWAEQHPEFKLYVKLHPLENPAYVTSAFDGMKNVTIFDKKISMPEAVSHACLVITAWSVASLEAALMKRPVVIANHRPYNPLSADIAFSDRFMQFEKFFPPRANNPSELHERIMLTLEDYNNSIKNATLFSNYHLEHGQNSQDVTAEYIHRIILGKHDNLPIFEL